MKLITYAQNQEDIMLHRALRDVQKGFFIDVGAQHPVVDSVTKFFYDQGWRGINIDPMPQWFNLLEAERSHDINLRLAVSDRAGETTFYGFVNTGLSTSDADIAKRHEKSGFMPKKIHVTTASLNSICSKYKVKDVHFLKIDVEGAELSVIKGFAFKRVRPWIVVVEAVEPVAQQEGDAARQAIPTFATWEPLLLSHDYKFAYWDGLNRFYVASEHAELIERLKIPANPLDGFTRYSDIIKQERIHQLEQEHRSLVDATEVNDKRREMGDIQGLVVTAQNRLQRIAELEQDNARLIGRESAMEAQLRESVST
nr:FkbM family methyltransferase [Halothiobacillus sp.]